MKIQPDSMQTLERTNIFLGYALVRAIVLDTM